ncbi:unannotated protein [freshwater metagenome]|uniref:Unannotated protein n=1 Tax=freshwater metagenome TaxID=449393 RepID=A0A6J7IDG1_9ZZZZ
MQTHPAAKKTNESAGSPISLAYAALPSPA